MLEIEGYKMYKGDMWISPISPNKEKELKSPFVLKGTWLYRPDTDCWYNGQSSFPSKICTVWLDDSI